jgi:hypothetical protein
VIAPLLLTRVEAAAVLSIAVKHFDRHVGPQLPKVHVGRLVRFRTSDVAAWVDRQAGDGEPRMVRRAPPRESPADAPAAFLPDTPRSERLLRKPRDYGGSSAPPLVLSPKAAAIAERIRKSFRVYAPEK